MAQENCLQDIELYKKRSLSLKDALELLSGKWKLVVLLHLYHHGTSRFKDLQEGCVSISPKVLSKELQNLEINQLITRTVNNTIPVTVSYAITEHALEIEPVIKALVEFGMKHRLKIIAAK